MDNLKPCPFCGGKASLYVNINKGISVICPQCKARSIVLSDLLSGSKMCGNATQAVIEAWNRRENDQRGDN